MRRIRLFFTGCLIILAGVSCLQPKDPVDRLVSYMESCLKILEKYQDNAVKAGEELYYFRQEREEDINVLLNEIKDYNPEADPSLEARAAEKLKPLAERMLKLLRDNPALYMNEYISRAFEGFELEI